MTEFENKTAEFNKSFDLVKAESNQGDKFHVGMKRLISSIWEFIKNPFDLQKITQEGSSTDREITIFTEHGNKSLTIKEGAEPKEIKVQIGIDHSGNGEVDVYNSLNEKTISINGSQGIVFKNLNILDVTEQPDKPVITNAVLVFSTGKATYAFRVQKVG